MEMQIRMPSAVILLTGTINVKDMVFMALQDQVVRENHYLEAISFYFKNSALPIIMVENTNHNFESRVNEEIKNSGRVEFLSFDGNKFPKERGKGYGEMESLIFAMQNSRLIDSDTKIIKVTGRYKVLNISVFIKSAIEDKMNKCQFLYFKGQPKAFSGIFICSKQFIVDFLGKNHHMMNDTRGIYFEHVLAHTILEYFSSSYTYSFLPAYPRLSGISGTENMQHRTNNYSFWLKRNLLYKTVTPVFKMLDWLILRYFQG